MKNKKTKRKDIRGATLSGKTVLLIALAAVVTLIAAGMLTLFFCGFRYMKVTYRSQLTGEDRKVTFVGFTDRSGAVRSGRIFSDRKASVKRLSDGRYEIRYSSGDVYTGQMDGLQRQGEGVMVYADGGRYEGGFFADRFDGRGVYHYADGDVYEGGFSAGKMSGEGRYTCMVDGAAAWEYTGSFKNDRREGHGVFKSADGAVYDGMFVNNLREDPLAEALIPALNGGTDRYYGGYKKDVRSGFGYYYYAGGNVYAGSFENNKPEGEGLICYAAGGGRKGIFKDGNLLKDSAVDLSPAEVQSYLENFSKNINPITGEQSRLPA